MKAIQFFIASILMVNTLQAQSENIFWNRDFWATHPTIEVIEQKISEGHSATALNPYGFDAVVYAILSKTPNKVVKHLLSKKGNDSNKLTHDKRTYVFWAAYKDNVDLMKHLIAKNAKMDLKDSHHFSVLTFAAATGVTNRAVYDLCIQNGIDIKTDKDEHGANALLLIAPFLEDESLINYFTSKGLSIHDKDNEGNGIFNYAARKGNKNFLNILIKNGVDYKALNNTGGNAFIFASQGTRSTSNTLKTYKYLEKIGLEPNITTDDGFTPLHALAYKNTDLEIFDYFLSKEVDVNQPDINGDTPFINAASGNSLERIEYLAHHVKNFNVQNKKGISPLMKAVESNNSKVVAFLLKKGANPLATDAQGNALVYYLLESYNSKDINDFDEKFRLLQNNNVDFKGLQANGNTLWHLAVKQNNVDLLEQIAKLKTLVNKKNNEGYTPLHLAAMKAKNATILEYLISVGADKTVKTDFDESVYDLANENEQLEETNINFLK
ncbi:ankyrin repeat domain-containing protein [Tamlana sp. 2201CG12-4]|uniref:ankyrin repeat domain-containing protein n=1 Tax=Tamlana sp. 2201CG12-4 TaxID=3112582 RepID=UPI002DBB05CA|nr:ankyrin repeat domain-containing protein [Tamlana sp. 2201CG12-4]MEC3906164.1 ankyrin repeat domain-containing protein [Tamlana sp. 2201CG12-4]